MLLCYKKCFCVTRSVSGYKKWFCVTRSVSVCQTARPEMPMLTRRTWVYGLGLGFSQLISPGVLAADDFEALNRL